MFLKFGAILLFSASATLAQVSPPPAQPANPTPEIDPKSAPSASPPLPEIPTHTLNFQLQQTGIGPQTSNLISLPVHCNADGTLFLNFANPTDLSRQSVVSVRGKTSHTYNLAAISGLYDIFKADFFPTGSTVGFLIRASKELPGPPGPGKSPAGIPWKTYHFYIALFDIDGSYKESLELPVFTETRSQVSRLAILPSGEFLVSGYDGSNRTPRLAILSASGQFVRDLDLPAARGQAEATEPASAQSSASEYIATVNLLGSISFTSWNRDILVWRRNSNDPVLDVGPGGTVREVPLQPPPGWVLEAMISSNDRWVARFHVESAEQSAPEKPGEHLFFELRPEDASLSMKLLQPAGLAAQIACESEGKYFAFTFGDKNQFQLLTAE